MSGREEGSVPGVELPEEKAEAKNLKDGIGGIKIKKKLPKTVEDPGAISGIAASGVPHRAVPYRSVSLMLGGGKILLIDTPRKLIINLPRQKNRQMSNSFLLLQGFNVMT
jgi:hypothetical protein